MCVYKQQSPSLPVYSILSSQIYGKDQSARAKNIINVDKCDKSSSVKGPKLTCIGWESIPGLLQGIQILALHKPLSLDMRNKTAMERFKVSHCLTLWGLTFQRKVPDTLREKMVNFDIRHKPMGKLLIFCCLSELLKREELSQNLWKVKMETFARYNQILTYLRVTVM